MNYVSNIQMEAVAAKISGGMAKFRLFAPLSRMSDEQAMWRVQNEEDQAAFAQLVKRWEGPIVRLCARMTGDLQRGEDLKQETFARVFARRKDFRPDARFSSWLWRIALNLCYDDLRRRYRQPLLAEDIAASSQMEGSEPASDSLAPDA